MPSFLLAFGQMVRRARELKNKAQPERYRRYRGSIELLVWCSWRLQIDDTVVASSEQDESTPKELLSLRGARVVDVKRHRPAWDLKLTFTNGRVLHVFCDRLTSNNWELWLSDGKVTAGPGASFEIQRGRTLI